MFRRVLAFGFVFAILAFADEGMWLFDHFPKSQIDKTYGIAVTDDFLRHLERASVRFNNGGSGSLISPHGLYADSHFLGHFLQREPLRPQ